MFRYDYIAIGPHLPKIPKVLQQLPLWHSESFLHLAAFIKPGVLPDPLPEATHMFRGPHTYIHEQSPTLIWIRLNLDVSARAGYQVSGCKVMKVKYI